MNAETIRELIYANPFRPFQVRLSDGSHFDVINRDHVLITKDKIAIGVEPKEGIAERLVLCSIIHITQVEELPVAA